MSGAVSTLIVFIGILGIGYYLYKGGYLTNIGGSIDSGFQYVFGDSSGNGGVLGDVFGTGGGGGGFGGPFTGGSGNIKAKAGITIYKGTGRRFSGNQGKTEAKQNWPMNHGGSRPSTRFLWYKNTGSGCVPYQSYEATVYAHVGSGKPASNLRIILGGGGGGQSGKNCCIYSLGFETTGIAYAEEEGPHSPHPTIAKMGVSPGLNIGPIVNRAIGLKNILYGPAGHRVLEGWVDSKADGHWQLFYKGINPRGGNLPVITHPGMAGESCQEIRFRCDGFWPVNVDTSRSFVQEIPQSPSLSSTAGSTVSSPGGTSQKGNATPASKLKTPSDPNKLEPSNKKKKKSKKKKSSSTSSNFVYLEQSPISTLYYPNLQYKGRVPNTY